MLVELKCFSRGVPFAQRDTLDVIDQILRKATVKNGRRYPITINDSRPGFRGMARKARWLGVHVLVLSGDRPDCSDEIVWDSKAQIDEQTLIEILSFDRDPDFPARHLDTRRHHTKPARERHPRLFGPEAA
jgi:hypothetical protein